MRRGTAQPAAVPAAGQPAGAGTLAQGPTVATTPPTPPPPNWPVNDPPRDASVSWSAQGLSIDARNSSLQQILDAISSETGAKVEGMDKDERVFGIYGPGDAREVLSQLLDGTDYNVLMVGNGKRGAPQQIVLSEKTAGAPQPNAPVNQGDMYEPPVAPFQPPQPVNPPEPPNQAPRSPQQILQEMQQRQMMMREQQMHQMQTQEPQQQEQQQQDQQQQ